MPPSSLVKAAKWVHVGFELGAQVRKVVYRALKECSDEDLVLWGADDAAVLEQHLKELWAQALADDPSPPALEGLGAPPLAVDGLQSRLKAIALRLDPFLKDCLLCERGGLDLRPHIPG